MTQPTRVLQVVTHMNRGGLETMLMNYYRHTDRNKVQFDFLAHRDDRAAYDDEIESLGGTIYRLPRLVPWSGSYQRALNDFFEKHPEYRIVHVHQDCLSSVILKAAQKNGVPVRIAHSHSANQDRNLKYPIKLWYKRSIPQYATALFACGKDAGDWMFNGASYQIVNNADKNFVNCDTLDIDENKVVKAIGTNRGNKKKASISLETYVMSKKLLIDLLHAGLNISSVYSLRDTIVDTFDDFKVGAYCHAASAYCISSLMAYFNSTMHIRKENKVKALITDEWPIHTNTNDSCPTLYSEDADVKGSIIGNGCIIEGTVINSVIGRNVVIKKGTVVKDSIILPNALINKNVTLENCVVDKYAIVTHAKNLKGEENAPLYVARRDRI